MAFSVQLDGLPTINDSAKIIFDIVISNVGNSYDSATGIFTVPHNGGYELTLHNMGRWTQVFTHIMRNQEILCTAYGVGTNEQGNNAFKTLKHAVYTGNKSNPKMTPKMDPSKFLNSPLFKIGLFEIFLSFLTFLHHHVPC